MFRMQLLRARIVVRSTASRQKIRYRVFDQEIMIGVLIAANQTVPAWKSNIAIEKLSPN